MSKISPLNQISGYGELISYYEANKDKKWDDWLSFDQTFEKPGKQGLVGLMKLKNLASKNPKKYVFKISQYINYLVQHELTVMKGLNEISPYCPHFCKVIGAIKCDVNPKYRKTGNPFKLSCKYPIEKEALLCEHIDKSCKFYNYIRSDQIPEKVLFSTTKQVLLAIAIAQKKKQFTHYDLHSYNVMMKKCNKDAVFLYVLDEENQFCIPTHGHFPVIIDFGFSYIKDMDNGPLWASLAHTDVGFMSDRFDWVADPKLFLVTVSAEIKDKRDSKNAKKLRRIVRNIFYPLEIDWESGWDDVDDKGASDYVTLMLEDYNDCSELFEEFDHYCIDLIQSLIILPLEEQNYSNIDKSYTAFLREWVKIENEISDPVYNLYVLKGLVDAARTVRPDYICLESRKQATSEFKRAVYEQVAKVSKFCRPTKINFEVMLCSLLVLARNVEGVLYDIMVTRMSEKEKEYEKLPLKSTEQIFGAIQANLPDDYVYNENTSVFVFDCVKEETNVFKPNKEYLDNINDTHPLARGTFLYDLYNGKQVY